MTPEGRVKAKVKRALKQLGADCWQFMPVQTGFGAPALDFLLSVRGRFVAIETKVPGKKLTPLQETTKAAIEAAGGIVLVVWDESTLAIAMKIILALEFAPHVPQSSPGQHIADSLDATRLRLPAGYGYRVERVVQEKDERDSTQHLRAIQQGKAPDAAAGGHHGAPGETSD